MPLFIASTMQLSRNCLVKAIAYEQKLKFLEQLHIQYLSNKHEIIKHTFWVKKWQPSTSYEFYNTKYAVKMIKRYRNKYAEKYLFVDITN